MVNQVSLFRSAFSSRAKLPCRISYYPNSINPTGFYTYIPHPKGKRFAIRKLFNFDLTTYFDNEIAFFTAVYFSYRVGVLVWGRDWSDSKKMTSSETLTQHLSEPTGITDITEVNVNESDPYFNVEWQQLGTKKSQEFFYPRGNQSSRKFAFFSAICFKTKTLESELRYMFRESNLVGESFLRADDIESFFFDTVRKLNCTDIQFTAEELTSFYKKI